MKNKIKLCLMGLVLALSCNKTKLNNSPEPNILPAATQEGANTYGCKMNGKQFAVSGSSLISAGFSGILYYHPTSVEYSGGKVHLEAYFRDRYFEINFDKNIAVGDNSDQFDALLIIDVKFITYHLMKSKPYNLYITSTTSRLKSGTFDFGWSTIQMLMMSFMSQKVVSIYLEDHRINQG